ncbi:MAG: M17 family peptidase N-terminal domain-containing protein, partial [Halomonas sp.]
MEFSVQTANPAKIETACLVVPIYKVPDHKSSDLLPAVAKLDDASEQLIGQLVASGDVDASLANVQLLPYAPGLGAERLLLVGLGEREKCHETAYLKALDAAMAALIKLPIDNASVMLTEVPLADRDAGWKARKVLESIERASYRFDQFKRNPAPATSLTQLNLMISN